MYSYWIETCPNKEIKRLEQNEEADICVIGAGILGMTTAYYLAKQGYSVIILEKDTVGSKTTGHTTAKITSQHGIIYDYLIKSQGKEFAKKYLMANEEAIQEIKKIVEKEEIECDFQEKNSYIYTTRKEEVVKLKRELEALQQIGFEKMSYEENLEELPFSIKSAIKFKQQAEFHPLKYMKGLRRIIEENKGKIYEKSTVYDVKKESDYYITNVNSYEIKSKYVVMATHYPILNFPGFYFTKIYQESSYIIAIETKNKIPQEMYINMQDPTYSLRTVPYKGKNILLIGGAGHKTGTQVTEEETYGKLEKFAKRYYKDSEVLFKWNTRDAITLDKIPYIGEFSTLMPNVYVGTGFNKWGMTSSHVAASIIVDKINNKENPYESVFNSTRLHPIKNRIEMKNMLVQSTKSLLTDKIKKIETQIEQIENGTGGIVEIEGEKVGIYKKENGDIFAVKPICTHLGCLLEWNNVDKTWDCPCHGSRFDFTGKNLYEPAIKDLEIPETIDNNTKK